MANIDSDSAVASRADSDPEISDTDETLDFSFLIGDLKLPSLPRWVTRPFSWFLTTLPMAIGVGLAWEAFPIWYLYAVAAEYTTAQLCLFYPLCFSIFSGMVAICHASERAILRGIRATAKRIVDTFIGANKVTGWFKTVYYRVYGILFGEYFNKVIYGMIFGIGTWVFLSKFAREKSYRVRFGQEIDKLVDVDKEIDDTKKDGSKNESLAELEDEGLFSARFVIVPILAFTGFYTADFRALSVFSDIWKYLPLLKASADKWLTVKFWSEKCDRLGKMTRKEKLLCLLAIVVFVYLVYKIHNSKKPAPAVRGDADLVAVKTNWLDTASPLVKRFVSGGVLPGSGAQPAPALIVEHDEAKTAPVKKERVGNLILGRSNIGKKRFIIYDLNGHSLFANQTFELDPKRTPEQNRSNLRTFVGNKLRSAHSDWEDIQADLATQKNDTARARFLKEWEEEIGSTLDHVHALAMTPNDSALHKDLDQIVNIMGGYEESKKTKDIVAKADETPVLTPVLADSAVADRFYANSRAIASAYQRRGKGEDVKSELAALHAAKAKLEEQFPAFSLDDHRKNAKVGPKKTEAKKDESKSVDFPPPEKDSAPVFDITFSRDGVVMAGSAFMAHGRMVTARHVLMCKDQDFQPGELRIGDKIYPATNPLLLSDDLMSVHVPIQYKNFVVSGTDQWCDRGRPALYFLGPTNRSKPYAISWEQREGNLWGHGAQTVPGHSGSPLAYIHNGAYVVLGVHVAGHGPESKLNEFRAISVDDRNKMANHSALPGNGLGSQLPAGGQI